MKKLSLKLDDLNVQSIETAPAVDGNRGTVLGLQDTASEESDTCVSLIYPCGSSDTCDVACGVPDEFDYNRRIIVYQTPS